MKTFDEMNETEKKQIVGEMVSKMFDRLVELTDDSELQLSVMLTMTSDMFYKCIVQGDLDRNEMEEMLRAVMRATYRAGKKTGRVN
jgi:hypothetical protein